MLNCFTDCDCKLVLYCTAHPVLQQGLMQGIQLPAAYGRLLLPLWLLVEPGGLLCHTRREMPAGIVKVQAYTLHYVLHGMKDC